jgi:hypothetical protein
MTDKFIVTECMGVKVLATEEIVAMLNSLNNTCIKLEERVASQLKRLEVAERRIKSLEDDLYKVFS